MTHEGECKAAYWRYASGPAWPKLSDFEKWQAAYRAGARYDQLVSGRLSPALTKFMEYVVWLQIMDAAEDWERTSAMGAGNGGTESETSPDLSSR